jgi:hypothetical protein
MMTARLRGLFQRLAAALALSAGLAGAGFAADMPPPRIDVPYVAPPGWTYRFASYGWLTSMQGTQTVRGRSVKVDASFIDIVEKTDSLMALMANFEARYGRFSLYTDFVWTKVGVEGSNLRARNPAPGIVGAIGTSLDVSVEMAIVEVGASYEIASAGPVAIDLLAGFRYWYQKADVSFDIAGVLDLGNLELVGGRGIARSGSVNWIDPVIGARLRYAVAPGHEVFLRGDIGGFGVGSKFSWQVVSAYSFEFGTWNNITFAGLVGYRALSVDYAKGSGNRRYEFDQVQHGPIIGISARF